ncbi:MAG: plasmid stabilization protein [Rhizobiaceae bacterium]
MPEPQLSVRSAKAIEIAHRLARHERRTVANVVERALEEYEARQTSREPIEVFLRRLAENGVDLDLMEVIEEGRAPYQGVDFSGPEYDLP